MANQEIEDDLLLPVLPTSSIKNQKPRRPSDLHSAFKEQHNRVVDIILSDHNYDKNPTDDNGLSYFHIACTRNDPKIVEKFVQGGGVDVNAQVRMDSALWPGYTALHFAIEFRAYDVARILLKLNANVTLRNGSDLTPLDIAILNVDKWMFNSRCNNHEVLTLIDAILSCAISLDTFMDDRGFTLLHTAIAKNDVPAIEKFLHLQPDLINKPINWTACNWHGYTPLHFAAVSGINKAADFLLLRGANTSAKNAEGNTPLHIAYNYYNHSTLRCSGYESYDLKWTLGTKFLTEDNPVGNDGLSHFHIACYVCDLEAVKHFLDLGIDVNQPTKSYAKLTPLHIASSRTDSNSSLAQLLLDRGADVNARDVELRTPLHSTYENCTDNVTRLLLSHGADVDARDKCGMTPLMFFCDSLCMSERHYDFLVDYTYRKIKLLIEYGGADINAEENRGRTPLTTWNLYLWYKDPFKLLFTLLMKHVNKLQILGHYISKKNQRKYTELHSANEKGWYDECVYVLECLEELGRLENTKINGYTTLHDVLHEDLNDLAVHSENSSLRELVESPERLKLQFPIYGYLLRLQFNIGLKRRPLLEQAVVAINWLIGVRATMPVACLEMILGSVSNADLQNVIDAAKAA